MDQMTKPFDVTAMLEDALNNETIQQEPHDAPRARPRSLRLQKRDDANDNLEGTTQMSENSGAVDSASESQKDIAEDNINPAHYRKHPSGIECIEVTRHMNFNTGNAVKYIWRYMDKGDPIENLQKAQWYLDDEIRRLKGLR